MYCYYLHLDDAEKACARVEMSGMPKAIEKECTNSGGNSMVLICEQVPG